MSGLPLSEHNQADRVSSHPRAGIKRATVQPGTMFCIDGSGNMDQKAADQKRPIYRLDVADGRISRPILAGGESAFQFFARQINNGAVPKPILIAADLPIGLPSQPSDVYETCRGNSGPTVFLQARWTSCLLIVHRKVPHRTGT